MANFMVLIIWQGVTVTIKIVVRHSEQTVLLMQEGERNQRAMNIPSPVGGNYAGG